MTEYTGGKGGAPNSGWLGTQSWEPDRPGTYNDNKYVGFTVTADSGHPITPNSIYFDLGMANNASPETVRILARSGSVGAFTQVHEETITYPTGNSNIRLELGPVDLSSFFTTPAEDFEFRFQVKDQSGGTDPLYRLSRLDNVSLLADITATGGLDGDYNGDGAVDAADYALWRSDPGSYGGAQGYTDWVNNFGATSGGGSTAVAAVPEPPAQALVLLAMIALPLLRRSYRREPRPCSL